MLDTVPDTIQINLRALVTIIGLFASSLILIAVFAYLPKLGIILSKYLMTPQIERFYTEVFSTYQNWGIGIVLLVLLDLFLSSQVSRHPWLHSFEIPLSIGIVFLASGLGIRILGKYFDTYLIDISIQRKRKIDRELLTLAKVAANGSVVLIIIFVFAQTHQINLFGLLASLGVGGLAVAFAAQKSLEQILGGIVLYIDRPFVIDDYIGLPDGTFGRVESIGLRSTKIRISGKGTLMIVPNSFLTQVNIENFTGAKKVISMIYLTFYRLISNEEKALIRQVILEGTHDIFGIDPRSTEITFKDNHSNLDGKSTQAQVSFFILGSGQVSMELRYQLLDVAKQSIHKQLKEYGIAFDIEEKAINVDSPITI